MESLEGTMDPQWTELNQKLDALTAQVAYLSEQARLNALERESREELLETAMPVAKDVMRLASDEMEEVQEYLNPEDLVRILKKIIQHTPQLEMLLDNIDAVTDLLDTVGPVVREGMDKVTEVTGDLETKGYFGLVRGGAHLADQVAGTLTEDDLKRLGGTLVPVLQAVKAAPPAQPPSLLGLLGQMNDPAVRSGLALALRALKALGASTRPA